MTYIFEVYLSTLKRKRGKMSNASSVKKNKCFVFAFYDICCRVFIGDIRDALETSFRNVIIVRSFSI